MSVSESRLDTQAQVADAQAFISSAVADSRAVLRDLWSGLLETMTPAVERAQHVMDVVAQTPKDDDDEWLARARELGWRG